MRWKYHWYDLFFVLAFVYLFILQIQAIWPFTIDDMYISLRYAKHWASGDGILWNLNAPPVEGYSNFSFVALGALSLLLHLDPVIVLKVAGLIGLFFSCVFIFLISRFWFEWRLALLSCIGLLLYKGQIIWAVSGLETTVYEALVAGAVYFSLRGLGYRLFPFPVPFPVSFPGCKQPGYGRGQPERFFLFGAGLFLALAGLTRPEAPALMLLFFILICWDRPLETKKVYWKDVLFFILPIILVFLPYFLWRWHYYGFLFPNSVYCKGLANSAFELDNHYLLLSWPFFVFALFATFRQPDKRYYFLWLPSLLYLLLLIGSDPIVAFDNRLFLAPFILLFPLALQGMALALLCYLKKRDQIFTLSLSLLAFCFAFLFIPSMSLADYAYFRNNPLKGEQLRGEVVKWLNTNTRQEDTVVLADAGYIPFYSNLNFIDSYCLNNAAMTQYAKDQMYEQFCQHILAQQPKVIILTSLIKQGEITYTPADQCLSLLLKKQAHYQLNKTFITEAPDSKYRYELFTNFE